MNVYIILAASWGYNDEYSYHEGEGGTPVGTFTDKAEAERVRDLFELRDWRANLAGSDLAEWCGNDLEDGLGDVDKAEAEQRLQAAFGYGFKEEYGSLSFVVPEEPTDEQIRLLQELFPSIEFNSVVESTLDTPVAVGAED
ncbi:MAG: hypothetical protein JSS66_05995 [Armatimonadetes bacterium]|nr:hypothetical protein [Armatimonadota bacterium]